MSSINDILIRIKNAYAVGHERVLIPYSSFQFEVAKVLKSNGFVSEVSKKNKRHKKSLHPYLEIKLKYKEDKTPTLNDVRLLSKSSRHLYIKVKEIKSVKSGHGILIISTPKGIMTGKEARKKNLGGEIMAEVW